MTRTCIDLFAGLGGFSSAFEDADGWRVVTVEIAEEFDPDICADVMDLRPSDLPDADVILASPPCTTFSQANQAQGHFVDGEPATEDAREAVALTMHAVGLIRAKAPEYWIVENPVGFMRRVLGPPTATVTWCQYGADVMKPTDLWGDHPAGLEYRTCKAGADCHERNPDGFGTTPHATPYSDDRAERALVPRGFSEEVLAAVEGRAEQTTLTEIAQTDEPTDAEETKA